MRETRCLTGDQMTSLVQRRVQLFYWSPFAFAFIPHPIHKIRTESHREACTSLKLNNVVARSNYGPSAGARNRESESSPRQRPNFLWQYANRPPRCIEPLPLLSIIQSV